MVRTVGDINLTALEHDATVVLCKHTLEKDKLDCQTVMKDPTLVDTLREHVADQYRLGKDALTVSYLRYVAAPRKPPKDPNETHTYPALQTEEGLCSRCLSSDHECKDPCLYEGPVVVGVEEDEDEDVPRQLIYHVYEKGHPERLENEMGEEMGVEVGEEVGEDMNVDGGGSSSRGGGNVDLNGNTIQLYPATG